MKIIELVILSIGLAMDAFAVSICIGLSMRKMTWKKAFAVGMYFAVFQACMPLLGFLLGSSLQDKIIHIDHWIAFLLLATIGLNMIKEAFPRKRTMIQVEEQIHMKEMIPLAVATSIDAFAVGVTFAFLKVNLYIAIPMVGSVALAMCMMGAKIGNLFGNAYERKAQLVGGIILMLLGAKILLEHLHII